MQNQLLNKIIAFLARSDIFFYTSLWLIILLIIGTIAENNQGLYYAQHTYFSVYLFWLFNFIPLPGTYTVLTIIFINLLAKLIVDKWTIKKLGTIVTHISGLLLLLGGFLTANFSHEAYLEIQENHSSNYTNDYNKLELSIKPISTKQSDDIIYQDSFIQSNNILKSDSLPFYLIINQVCKNCAVIQDNKNNRTIINKLPKPKDSEQINTVISLNTYENNTHLLLNNNYIYLQNLNINTEQDKYNSYLLNYKNKNYKIILRSARTYLPFSIKLNRFQADMHPGTEIAKSYQSNITLKDNLANKTINSTISMNEPLRYKGYTFYQSSYITNDKQYTTILATVYNVGQNFPYIASIILSIGILIHLVQRLPIIRKK